MPLSTDLHAGQVVLAAVCALTAAGMHWAAVTAAAAEVRPRVLWANLAASAAGGLLASQLLALVPAVTLPPLLAVALAAVVGHVLGPRALWWLGSGALSGLAHWLPWVKTPELPAPQDPPARKEAPPDG